MSQIFSQKLLMLADRVKTTKAKHIEYLLGKSKEVGTPRYLSLVVPLKKVGNEAVKKELNDRMERAATTASSLEAEQDSEGSEDFHQIIDFLNLSHIKYALTENSTIYTSLIQQFWETASASTSENKEIEITATIDGRVKTITEASIRRHLKLEDSYGIPTLSNAEIFEQLALMWYASDSDKLTFQKGHFSPPWRFLIHTILHFLSPKKTAWEQFSSNIATAIICLATNRTFNFSKMIFEGMLKNLESRSKFLVYPRFIQIFLNKHKRHLLPRKRTYVVPTLIQKLFSNMIRVSKGYTGVNIPLFPTMLTAPESSPSKITSSPSLSPQTHPSTSQQPPTPPFMQTIHDAEEPATMPHDSSQPRVQSLGSDEGSLTPNELTVLCTTLSKKIQEDAETQGRTSADTEILLEQEEPTELVEDPGSGEKGEKEISITEILVSTASAIPEKKTKKQLEQEKLGHKEAIRLQEHINKEERQRIARDAEIAKQLQEEIDIARQEQEKYDLAQALELQKELDKRKEDVAETTQAHDIDWSDPAVLRYHAQQNRSFSKAEYGDQNQAFVPKNSEIEKEVMKRPGFDLQQKQPAEEEKLQKNDDSSKPSGGSRK
ncbi:hypothetical protein Tco_0930249 [Tanacetum coccineum]